MKWLKSINQKTRKLNKNLKKHTRILAIIASVTIIGTASLILTNASAFTSSIEPESGTVSDQNMIVSNSAASNGAAIRFKDEPITDPEPSCETDPSLCPSTGTSVPNINEVGPKGSLTNRSCAYLSPGVYQNINCTDSAILQGSGDYTFINARMPSIKSTGGGALFPRNGSVTLEHTDVRGGLWFENNGSQGGQSNWTIKWSKIYGGVWQALRPKGGGTINVSDSWLLSDGTPPDGAHTEVLQHMYGADGRYERVGFSRQPVTNNTVTAVLTMESPNDGGNTYFIDCVVGYWNGSNWTRGGGNYAVYPGKSHWIRPVIYGTAQTAWYQQPVTLVDPEYR